MPQILPNKNGVEGVRQLSVGELRWREVKGMLINP